MKIPASATSWSEYVYNQTVMNEDFYLLFHPKLLMHLSCLRLTENCIQEFFKKAKIQVKILLNRACLTYTERSACARNVLLGSLKTCLLAEAIVGMLPCFALQIRWVVLKALVRKLGSRLQNILDWSPQEMIRVFLGWDISLSSSFLLKQYQSVAHH